MKAKTTTRLALGRAHGIGEIFDATEESFTGIQVFSGDIDQFVNKIDCGGNIYNFVTEETLENKLNNMNIEAELKMSIVAGLIKVEGSGKYLNETSSSSEKISYSVILKIRTKRHVLQVHNIELRKDQKKFPSSLIDPYLGTHIINGITWGIQIIATFTMDISKIRTDFSLEGNLNTFIKKVCLDISGSAKFSNTEHSELYRKNISVNIIGDIMPIGQDSLITDLDGYKSYLKSVPSMLQSINGGLGVPLEYNLFPLIMLFDEKKTMAHKILNEMSQDTILNSVKIMDSVKKVENEIKFTLEDCYRYEDLFRTEIKELISIRDSFETETLTFKSNLQKQVILFRTAEDCTNFTGLVELFSEYSKSPNYHAKVKEKITNLKNYCDRKIKFFDRFQRKHCKIMNPQSFYDETYTDDFKFKTFILYTSMKFFDTIYEETNKIHGVFYDLCIDENLKNNSFYFIFDYESIPEIYKQHGSPDRPRIIYECKRERITDDYYSQHLLLNRVRSYFSWGKAEEEMTKIFKFIEIPEDFAKEKNEFFFKNAKYLEEQLLLDQNENNNKFMAVLIVGSNISRTEEQDNYEFECFKDLIITYSIKKVLVVLHEKFKKVEHFSNVKKFSIFLYSNNHLVTSDYSAERQFIHKLLDLPGVEYINTTNYKNFGCEDKMVFFYSGEDYKQAPEIFNNNCQKFRNLIKEKEKKANLEFSNLTIEEKLKAIIGQSKYYFFNCDQMPFDTHSNIYSYFSINKVIKSPCIWIYYSKTIITSDYINDPKAYETLNELLTEAIEQFGVPNSKPKKIEFSTERKECYARSVIKIDDRNLVSAGNDGSIKVWDFETKQCKTLEKPFGNKRPLTTMIKFSNQIVITGGDEHIIRIFNIESGKCLKSFQEHDKQVILLCMINKYEFISGTSNELRLWDLNSNLNKSIATIPLQSTQFHSIALMENYEILTGCEDKIIRSWDINSKNCLYYFEGHGGPVISLTKVNVDHFASGSLDNTIKIWEYHNGICIKTFLGHSKSVCSLLLVNKKFLASGSDDCTVKIWDMETGNCSSTLEGHTSKVSTLSKLNDYDIISSSMWGEMFIIWRNCTKFK